MRPITTPAGNKLTAAYIHKPVSKVKITMSG
eukprot:COSAG04_NODE_30536_length_262_cov_0.631902_1_plen_30_part_10